MSLASLIGIDRERYDAGNKFLSQDPYLQNFQARDPITFNVSPPVNTGIMSPNLLYGAGSQGGGDGDGGITTIDPSGFKQVDNMFPLGTPGMDVPAINFKDAPVDFNLRQNNPRVFDPFTNIKNAVDLKAIRDFGLKAVASDAFAKGGAMTFGKFGMVPAIAGAVGGGLLGLGVRGPTVEQQVVANFYGNMGNTPSFYMDPETGELVPSAMQGYNISSAYGKGIGAAIDKRIDRIVKTINRPGYKGNLGKKGGLLDRLQKEKAALEASQIQQARNLQDYNREMRTGGYQATANYDTDFMEGDPNAGGKATTATMGSS